MKRFSLAAISLMMVAAVSAMAAPNASISNVPAFPGTLANARFVYVASFDGSQFDAKVLPEDRHAIDVVQNAIQSWGKLQLVYQPGQADIIILVSSRATEDVMAVYDSHVNGNFLWRVMGRDGLQAGETPLMTEFEKGFESISQHNAR
jgi:hypothetical protein